MDNKFAKRFVIVFAIFSMVAALLVGVARSLPKKQADFSIVATNFASYDFARAIVGDAGEVKMLLKPAAEMHDYEPTPQDIVDISKADFFIYTGGESDGWVDNMLRDNNIDLGKTLRLIDFVDLKNEEIKEGMDAKDEEEGEEEIDEHVWTSPVNAIRIVQSLRDHFIAKKPAKLSEFTDNAQKYIYDLEKIDEYIKSLLKSAKRKELIFADRFPFRYFVDEYGLDYYAAFPGCAEQTEASSSTIAFLIDKVKADKIPVVLKIELTNGALAQTIADETGAKVYTLNAAHNISQEDFDAGKTYVDIMYENIEILKKALLQ